MAERKQARLIILDSSRVRTRMPCPQCRRTVKKIVSNMDSDGDYYDTLRQNDLL